MRSNPLLRYSTTEGNTSYYDSFLFFQNEATFPLVRTDYYKEIVQGGLYDSIILNKQVLVHITHCSIVTYKCIPSDEDKVKVLQGYSLVNPPSN